jgi:ribosome-associated heat shock protein Hsp15
MSEDREAPGGVRLDVWLDVACLYRTRSEAQKACQNGKVEVNGQAAKPKRRIHIGDELQIKRPFGRQQRVAVRALAASHIRKADAKQLYEDLTPPPTAEEVALRRTERVYRAAMTATGSPDKRQRRALRKMKGRD